jgi:hypothetical protein
MQCVCTPVEPTKVEEEVMLDLLSQDASGSQDICEDDHCGDAVLA